MKTYRQLSSKAILTYIFSFLLQFFLLSGTDDIIRSFYMFTRLFPNCFYDTMPYRNESEYKKDIKIVYIYIYIYIYTYIYILSSACIYAIKTLCLYLFLP